MNSTCISTVVSCRNSTSIYLGVFFILFSVTVALNLTRWTLIWQLLIAPNAATVDCLHWHLQLWGYLSLQVCALFSSCGCLLCILLCFYPAAKVGMHTEQIVWHYCHALYLCLIIVQIMSLLSCFVRVPNCSNYGITVLPLVQPLITIFPEFFFISWFYIYVYEPDTIINLQKIWQRSIDICFPTSVYGSNQVCIYHFVAVGDSWRWAIVWRA